MNINNLNSLILILHNTSQHNYYTITSFLLEFFKSIVIRLAGSIYDKN